MKKKMMMMTGKGDLKVHYLHLLLLLLLKILHLRDFKFFIANPLLSLSMIGEYP
jgi:hypothetical protein